MAALSRFTAASVLLLLAISLASGSQPVDVIWSDATTGQILRGTAGSGGVAHVLFESSDYPSAPSSVAPFGIAADESFVYWSDASTGQILRGALDGQGPAVALFDAGDYPGAPSTIGPSGLGVDGSFVYWADNATGEILRGLKDGSGAVQSLFDASDYPSAPADIYPWGVVVGSGNVYWSDSDSSQILVGAADGSSAAQALFTSADERVNLGIALDGSYVYWGDTENVGLQGTVLRGLTSGGGSPELLYEPADYPGAPTSMVPIGMAAHAEQLYWIDSLTKLVLTASASGIGAVSLLFDASNYPGSPLVIGPAFLTVVSVGYDADYDGDGDVDGRDFLVWQRGQTPDPRSAADLALWQGQYGTGSFVAAMQAVPEPTGVVAGGVAALLLTAARRPRVVSIK